MKRELKAKWLEALRSGKYEKGTHHLRDGDNKFCCLGVLCDLIDPCGWKFDEYQGVYEADGEAAGLGQKAQDLTGISALGDVPGTVPLAVLNDRSDTFEPVIEAIEKYVPVED